MKYGRLLILFFNVLLAVVTISCTSEGFNMGIKYLDEEVRTVIIDTCTVKLTTITIDSLVTSGNDAVLTGRYRDNMQGESTCTAYIPYKNPGSQAFPAEEVIFDSLELVIKLNGTWYGDTLQYQDYNIYELIDVMEEPDNKEFYSNQTVEHQASPLISFRIKPKPSLQDEFAVRLPDYTGSDLFRVFVEDDVTVLGSDERFSKYFKGFAITAGGNNNCMLGFDLSDTSMTMRLHYHYSTSKRMTGIIEISANTDLCFYGISTNRLDTPFEKLKNNQLPSTETGNMVLVQALTASYVKIEFPYLNNLLELGDYGTILEASLSIDPVRGSYSEAAPLPSELSLYISDENNVSLSPITNYSGDALQTGNLVVDDLFGIDTRYTYDITDFISGQLGQIGINKRCLQLIVPGDDLATSFKTLIAGDALKSGNNARLIISYFIYNEE